jgi:hypothetical protein
MLPQGWKKGNYQFGDIIRFTYEHQDVDASTDGKYKECLVLNPLWNNKVQCIDLKRLSPAQREVLEAVLDPARKDEVHRLPLVNDIKRRMDPVQLIGNPLAFYSRFVKPFLQRVDAYRQYIPHRMSGVTKVRDQSISGGYYSDTPRPLFGKPSHTTSSTGAKRSDPGKPLTAIDIMKQNANKKGLK